jgi:predicted dehydrogenase
MRGGQTIGLIGCGNWGRHILRDLRVLECRVAVVARSESSRARAAEGNAAAIVPDVEGLPAVDGIVIATTSASHAEVVESLLDRGVPIFVEKPLTVDPVSADRIAARAPDRVFVMDKWRYHPGVLALAAIARSGELGPVLGLRTMRLQLSTPHRDLDAVWHLAPHDLAIALEILGAIPEPAGAVGERAARGESTLLGFFRGTPWLAIEVSSRHRRYQRELRLHCAEGVAVLSDAYSDHLEITRPVAGTGMEPPPAEQRPIAGEMPLLAELRAFVRHLEGGPPPRSSATEGALIVRTIARLRALAGLDTPRP